MTESKCNSMGERIKQTRERKGIMQQNLADAVGLNVSVLSRIENGARKVRSNELIQIANQLNVSTDYLLQGTSLEQNPADALLDDMALRKLARKSFQGLSPQEAAAKQKYFRRILNALFENT